MLALGFTTINVYVSYLSYQLGSDIQQSAIFAQFQMQYNMIASRFPAPLLDPTFRPVHGSEDYRRLTDYWIFCYAQWFETEKSRFASHRALWTQYYSGLVLNALEIPSLRYVFLEMQKDYGVNRPEMQEFYRAIGELAAKAGQPLVPAGKQAPITPKPANQAN